jgi:LPS export ABC transporter protein LptC
VLALTVAASLPGCTRNDKAIPRASDTTQTVFQEIEGSSLYLFDGLHKSWMLQSDYMRKSQGDTGSILGWPVKLTLYDSAGAVSSVVLADTGTTNRAKDRFTVWGNVYVRNQDSLIVRAQKLCWSGASHQVSSDDFVQIRTTKGDLLRGKGLDASETFSWWEFHSNVSGRFPDFKRRMDADGDLGFGPASKKRTSAATPTEPVAGEDDGASSFAGTDSATQPVSDSTPAVKHAPRAEKAPHDADGPGTTKSKRKHRLMEMRMD